MYFKKIFYKKKKVLVEGILSPSILIFSGGAVWEFRREQKTHLSVACMDSIILRVIIARLCWGLWYSGEEDKCSEERNFPDACPIGSWLTLVQQPSSRPRLSWPQHLAAGLLPLGLSGALCGPRPRALQIQEDFHLFPCKQRPVFFDTCNILYLYLANNNCRTQGKSWWF